MKYDSLMDEIQNLGIEVINMKFNGNSKGLYGDNTIAIDPRIETENERVCVLAEELGHHHKTVDNILNTSIINNLKQEKIARNWGYEKLVDITFLITAFKKGVRGRSELAEYLNITEQFLEEAIKHYKEKYGSYYQVENYIVYFDPNLGILELY